jgi:3-hydroxymyristoyl/3-hydroxydecanoyl-(acyl carrier protein) dehydratase
MNDSWTGEILVSADHPALSGHFPGNPIVPGVVLLDAVLAEIRSRLPCVLRSIPNVKFLQAVLPGERIELRVDLATEATGTLRARFGARRDLTAVFEGTFLLTTEPGEPA